MTAVSEAGQSTSGLTLHICTPEEINEGVPTIE